MITLTTQCYIRQNRKYLMLHRTKKENDLNEGKYIACGGHIEAGETPYECAKREIKEETGLTLNECTFRGIVHFISPEDEEEMFIYTSDSFSGDVIECDEGDLEWVQEDKLMDLNLWEGDRKFLKLIMENDDFFRMTLRYDAKGNLIETGFEDPFLLQKENAVERIAAHIDPSVKKVLVVTGRSSARRCGALDDLDKNLGQLGIEYTVFDRVEENPSVETVMAAGEEGRAFGADAVIAIGGGSPMDAAKGAALLIRNPDKGIDYLYEKNNESSYVPVICIPTTCGTGSEATGVSVLSRPAIGEKGSIPYRIWPILGLMDPSYLKHAPLSVIRDTAIDALAHLCESYVSTKANDVSRAIVMQGLNIWSKAKDALLKEEVGDDARRNLMIASTLGGMAIATTSTSLPHSLSYPLTTQLDFAHGVAVGYFLAGYLREAGDMGKTVIKAAGFTSFDDLNDYYLKVCAPKDVPVDILRQSANKTFNNPDKMSLCPYEATIDTLYEMACRPLI